MVKQLLQLNSSRKWNSHEPANVASLCRSGAPRQFLTSGRDGFAHAIERQQSGQDPGEEELGTPLFSRIGHKSELTAAGEIAYRRALVLLAERSDLVAEINDLLGLKRGVLRIGLPPVGSGELFAAMFAVYRQRYPQIDIELIEHGSKSWASACKRGGGCGCPAGAGGGRVRVSGRARRAVDGGPAQQPSIGGTQQCGFSDLSDSPFILFEAGFALNRIILSACERRGVSPKVSVRSAQIDFIVDLVGAEPGRCLPAAHAGL